jgi:hypothetical protein
VRLTFSKGRRCATARGCIQIYYCCGVDDCSPTRGGRVELVVTKTAPFYISKGNSKGKKMKVQ